MFATGDLIQAMREGVPSIAREPRATYNIRHQDYTTVSKFELVKCA
jgi:hypothetical protein